MAERMTAPGTALPRVVVIDSGVDGGHHPQVCFACTFVAGPAFGADGTVTEGGGGTDTTGHGTAVAAALLAAAAGPCELIALRVFDGPTCAFAAVVHALEHAISLRPAVVNASLGTTSLAWRPRLRELAALLREHGGRLVAPASYAGLPCDPGALDGVDAVVADANVPRGLPELRPSGGPSGGRLVWFASPLPAPGRDGVITLRARGESLAAAAVSGFLVRQLRG